MTTATLVIENEVTCKFNGLPPDVRRKMVKALEFEIPGARFTPAYKLGRWNGLASYCTIAGSTYINLLDKLLGIVDEAGYEVIIDDQREPTGPFSFQTVDENSYSHVKWPKGHPKAGTSVVLNEHQISSINDYLTNLTGIAIIPTGGGKCLAYETKIPIVVDRTTTFGIFLVDKLNELSEVTDDRIDIEIGMLGKCIEEFKDITFRSNKEVDISDLNLFAITDKESTTLINYFIKKKKLDNVTIVFDNGYTFSCAKNHLLRQDGKDILVSDLAAGDMVDHINGKQQIIMIDLHDVAIDCYDIGIDAPHFYRDSNGIIHHNTVITAILSQKVEVYGRSIVIVPTKDLVTQTEEDYKNFGLDVGVFYGDRKEYNKKHTICTWQSLESLYKKSSKEELEIDINAFFTDVVCVITDETHRVKGAVLQKLLSGPLAYAPIRWGLTGTLPEYEADQVSLLACIGPVIGKIATKDLQDTGILANLHINVIQLKDLGERAFASYQAEQKWLTSSPPRIKFLAESFIKIAESGNTLILVDRVQTGEMLEELIPDSIFISGKMKSEDRKDEYKGVQNVNGKILIATFGVASTGININRIFNLILIEPGKSFIKVIQSIGRGLRIAEDKDFVNVYDICSVSKYSKKHLTARKKFYTDAQYPYTVTKVGY